MALWFHTEIPARLRGLAIRTAEEVGVRVSIRRATEPGALAVFIDISDRSKVDRYAEAFRLRRNRG